MALLSAPSSLARCNSFSFYIVLCSLFLSASPKKVNTKNETNWLNDTPKLGNEAHPYSRKIGLTKTDLLDNSSAVERIESCEINVREKNVDTSRQAVRISWSVDGCPSGMATADIQIRANTTSKMQCGKDISFSEVASCDEIVAIVGVDYQGYCNMSRLNPFENYTVSITKLCIEECSCVSLSKTEMEFRSPPRSLAKMVDNNALSVPVNSSYCDNVDFNDQLLFRLNSSYFSHEGAAGILGYHVVLAPRNSFANFDPSCFESAVSSQEAAAGGFRGCFYLTNRSVPLNPFMTPISEETACCLLTGHDQDQCRGGSASVDILIAITICDTGDHCASLLPAGESFWVGVMAVPDAEICADGSVYCESLLEPVYLYTLLTTTTDQQMINTGKFNVGMIVGGIIGGVALVGIIIGLAIFCCRRRHHRFAARVGPCGGERMGRSRPIDLHKFKDVLPELMRNSAFALLEEYAALNERTSSIGQRKQIYARKEENMPRNRYIDILPFDDTRVTLKGDRYINASFIMGFNRRSEYIAAQGPLGEEDRRMRGKHSTIGDFYEMIWQKNVYYIVMLTQLFETGRPKCAQYWPALVGEAVQHGAYSVKLINEIDCGSFWKRELEVKRTSRSRLVVVQYHYKKWPDMTSTDEKELLAFINIVRSSVNTTRIASPILVHCSAGVGRTGVFIAMDVLLQHIRRYAYIDILATVYALRQQRVRMEQYIMLYSATGIALERLLRSAVSKMPSKYARPKNDKTGTTL